MSTIIVIDDDQALTRALSIRLRSAGFVVHVANDGASGSRLVVKERADLILLDVNMPGFSGLELHECLKCSDRTRDIPVVYLSGADSHFARVEALQQGARAFLSKPYDPVQLIQTIRGILKISASPKELASTGG